MITPTAPATDFVLPELMQLLLTARVEMDRHTNSDGRCQICQVNFPCQRAVLADLALAAL